MQCTSKLEEAKKKSKWGERLTAVEAMWRVVLYLQLQVCLKIFTMEILSWQCVTTILVSLLSNHWKSLTLICITIVHFSMPLFQSWYTRMLQIHLYCVICFKRQGCLPPLGPECLTWGWLMSHRWDFLTPGGPLSPAYPFLCSTVRKKAQNHGFHKTLSFF